MLILAITAFDRKRLSIDPGLWIFRVSSKKTPPSDIYEGPTLTRIPLGLYICIQLYLDTRGLL